MPGTVLSAFHIAIFHLVFEVIITRVTIFYLLIFLAVLGLHCCMGFSLVVASRGYSLVAVCRLLTVVASLAAEPGL